MSVDVEPVHPQPSSPPDPAAGVPVTPGPVRLPARRQHSITVAGRVIPVLPPNPRDPRLHLALVIVSVITIGVGLLDFRLSIPQILIPVVACAVVEAIYQFIRTGAIVWPASGMQTATSTVLILRVTGVEHGDWWTFAGLHWFLLVAIGGLLTKYFLRTARGHVFNPSNVTLVIAFLLLGADRIEPLDYWWGPLDWRMWLAYAVIVIGGLTLCRRLGLLAMAVSFWLTLAAGMGILAALGQSITTRWSFAPVEGWHFWRTVVLSPETLIFLFFMITDPRTTPRGRVSRVVFGVSVGIVSTLLIAPWPTEFGTKVGLLSGLAVMSVLRYALEHRLPAAGGSDDSLPEAARRLFGTRHGEPARRRRGVRVAMTGLAVALVGSGVAVAGAPNRGGTDAFEVEPDVAAAARDGAAPGVEFQQGGDVAGMPIVIDDDVAAISRQLATEAGARQLVAALQFNLGVETEAIVAGDPGLLEAVDHGQRLIDMSVAAEAGSGRRVALYRFDTLHLGVAFPGGFQSGPNAALTVTGAISEASVTASGVLAPADVERPLALTFTLRQTPNGVWLTTGTSVPPASATTSAD